MSSACIRRFQSALVRKLDKADCVVTTSRTFANMHSLNTARRCCSHSRSHHYVSFADAAGFSQAPKSTIGLPPQQVPETSIQAYVLPAVVTPAEEASLLQFTAPWFDRLPYGEGHIDGLIHHYKEFYRPYGKMMVDDAYFSPPSTAQHDAAAAASPVRSLLEEDQQERLAHDVRSALTRCREIAADHLPHIPVTDRVHFLQLHGDGFIRAHVDESRNSSGIVAGLTLGSGRVMSLTNPKYPNKRIDLLLAPRSFYVLCGTARHEWEHSVDWTVDDDEHMRRVTKSHVAEGSEVLFEGKPSGVFRNMRTAIIFRGISPMELLMRRMEAKKQTKRE